MPGTICKTVIDWAATGSMLQGIGTIGGVCAVVWAAINAANVWKKQKQAERRFELAERIITATYKGREALASVRSQMVWGFEQNAAENKLKEDQAWVHQTDARKKRLITAWVSYNRLDHTKDEQLALDECLPMARALFSDELEKAIKDLRHQFWIVRVDAESHIDDEGQDPEFSKKLRRGMYDITAGNGDKNQVTETIKEAVQVIGQACEPALKLEAIKAR